MRKFLLTAAAALLGGAMASAFTIDPDAVYTMKVIDCPMEGYTTLWFNTSLAEGSKDCATLRAESDATQVKFVKNPDADNSWAIYSPDTETYLNISTWYTDRTSKTPFYWTVADATTTDYSGSNDVVTFYQDQASSATNRGYIGYDTDASKNRLYCNKSATAAGLGKFELIPAGAAPEPVANVSVTFNYPLGDANYTVTKEVKVGANAVEAAQAAMPTYYSYTVSGISGQAADYVLTDAEGQTYTVEGTWGYLGKVGRFTQAKGTAASNVQRYPWKYYVDGETNGIKTQESENADEFTAERLFIMNGKLQDGEVLVSIQGVKPGADKYFNTNTEDRSLKADGTKRNGNVSGSFGTTEQFYRVENNGMTDGSFCLAMLDADKAEADQATGVYVQDYGNDNGLGIRVSNEGRTDASSNIKFSAITEADWATEGLNETVLDAAKADPSLANMIALFEDPYADAYAELIAKGDELVASNGTILGELGVDLAAIWAAAKEANPTSGKEANEALQAVIDNMGYTAAITAYMDGKSIKIRFEGSDTGAGEDYLAAKIGDANQPYRWSDGADSRVFTLKAIEGKEGLALYNEYMNAYLVPALTNNTNAHWSEKPEEASTFLFTCTTAGTGLADSKFVIGNVQDGSDKQYLHSNVNKTIFRWTIIAPNSQWGLEKADELLAAQQNLIGAKARNTQVELEGNESIGTAVGQYSLGCTPEEYTAAWNFDVASTDVEGLRAAAAAINGGLSINMPEAGHFYRFQNVASLKYMANTNNDSDRIAVIDDENADSTEDLFYYDGKYLVSTSNGMVLGKFLAGKTTVNWKFVLAADETNASVVEFRESATAGQFNIVSNASPARFLYGAANLPATAPIAQVDCGGSDGGEGYRWLITEATELNVPVASTGFTFCSPVALQYPEGSKVYTLAFNEEAVQVDATRLAITSSLAPLTPYYIVPAEDANFVTFTPAVDVPEYAALADEEGIHVAGSYLAQGCNDQRSFYGFVDGSFFPFFDEDVIPGFTAYVDAPYTEDDYVYPLVVVANQAIADAIESLKTAMENENAWIGEGYGKYTASELYIEVCELVNQLIEGGEDYDLNTFIMMGAYLEAGIAENTLNMPQAGDFLTIRNVASENYMANANAEIGGETRNPVLPAEELTEEARTFYYDGQHLVSAANGLVCGTYVRATSGASTHESWALVPADKEYASATVEFKAAATRGTYNIVVSENRYLYGACNLPTADPLFQVDCGSNDGGDGYRWNLAEVEALTVTVPEGTTAITYCSPEDLKAPEGWKLYTLTYNPNRLTELVKHAVEGDDIEAETAYYVEVTPGTYTLEFPKAVDAPEVPVVTEMIDVNSGDDALVGSVLAFSRTDDFVPYSVANDKFIPVETYAAGFAAHVIGADASVAEYTVVDAKDAFPGEEDGINSVEAASEDVIYDLQGRRINRAAHGLYIINGRKVIR